MEPKRLLSTLSLIDQLGECTPKFEEAVRQEKAYGRDLYTLITVSYLLPRVLPSDQKVKIVAQHYAKSLRDALGTTRL